MCVVSVCTHVYVWFVYVVCDVCVVCVVVYVCDLCICVVYVCAGEGLFCGPWVGELPCTAFEFHSLTL